MFQSFLQLPNLLIDVTQVSLSHYITVNTLRMTSNSTESTRYTSVIPYAETGNHPWGGAIRMPLIVNRLLSAVEGAQGRNGVARPPQACGILSLTTRKRPRPPYQPFRGSARNLGFAHHASNDQTLPFPLPYQPLPPVLDDLLCRIVPRRPRHRPPRKRPRPAQIQVLHRRTVVRVSRKWT